MAQDLGAALELLAKQVTFREEADLVAFNAALHGDAEEGDLEDLTKAELVDRAEAAGIEVGSSDTKAEIAAKLQEAEQAASGGGV